MRKILLSAAAAALAGCVTVGRPFNVSYVPKIEVGRTTEQDLSRWFGEPYRTGMDDGDETSTWLHYKLRLLGDKNTRDLYVRFTADRKVKSYSFNSNFPGDREAARLR